MFNKARITLTIWYSLAVMIVSLVFSFFIYKSVSLEFERGFRRVAMMQEAEKQNVKVPPQLPPRFEQMHPQIFNIGLSADMVANINLVKRRFVGWLALINSIIFTLSLALGYLIAGESLKPLKEAHESQKRFVADASHELKTPLSVIKTSIEVLQRKNNSSKQEWQQLAESMIVEVDALQKLTEGLLTLTGVGQSSEKFSKVNLKDSINKVIARIKPLADENEVKISTSLKNIQIEGQSENLEQLWMILFDNAIKYSSKKGKVSISIKDLENKVQVEISDNGVGINEKDLGKIFDRFYRADTSRSKSKTNGFGLGLSIAKQIVTNNRGSIKVSSGVGKGTTFFVTFPQA